MAHSPAKGSYKASRRKRKAFHPKKPRTKKGRGLKHRGSHLHTSGSSSTSSAPGFSEQAGASSTGGAHDGALPLAGVGSTAGVSARALLALTGLSGASAEGLTGALLDLVGEGHITAHHALSAWAHEQDRIANRAWRRPGGLVRMGGL